MTEEEKKVIFGNIKPNFNTNLENYTITMDLDYYNCLEEYIRKILDENKNLKAVIEKKNHIIECLEKGIEHEDELVEETRKTVAKINLLDLLLSN